MDFNPPPRVPSWLEGELRVLLGQGRKIEAIKRYREATGVGLKEAKDAVEALAGSPAAPLPLFEDELLATFRESGKISAIRLYRNRTGSDLRSAKDAVEALAARKGIVGPGPGCLGVVAIALHLGGLGLLLLLVLLRLA